MEKTMPRALSWLLLASGAALIAGAAALWLERGNAMLLDLSAGAAAFFCL